MTRSFPDTRQIVAYREAARTGAKAAADNTAVVAPGVHQAATTAT
jgi:hypothetical protein